MVSTGVNPAQWIGGVENHVHYLVKSLSKIGNQIHYVTDLSKEADIPKELKVHKINSPRFRYPAAFPSWAITNIVGSSFCFKAALKALLLNRHEFDVVHTHGYLSSYGVLKIPKDSPLVFTMHNPTPLLTSGSYWEQLFRNVSFECVDLKVLKKADQIITISRKLKEDITRFWGISREKVTVIHNCVDTDTFRPDAKIWSAWREKYRINDRYFLFVGQLTRRKGVDYLMKAISCIKDLDICCLIVGTGPLQSYLVKLVEELKISDKVFFCGYVPFWNLPSVYSNADFLVLPTIGEGGPPLAMLEAMACGLPVITTDTSGISEVVRNNHNGFVIPPRDIPALCRLIVTLIENPSLRRSIGANARKTILSDFNWSAAARKTMQVYERAMN